MTRRDIGARIGRRPILAAGGARPPRQVRATMAHRFRGPALLVCAGLASLPAAAQDQVAVAAPLPLALVVAETTYRHLPGRPECAEGAARIASALEETGFAVTLASDNSHGQLSAALMQFRGDLQRSQSPGAVIYYCGFGTMYDGRSFVLPASARMDRLTDAVSEGLAARVFGGLPGTALLLYDIAPLRAEDDNGMLLFDLRADRNLSSVFAASQQGATPVADAFAVAARRAAPALGTADLIAALDASVDPSARRLVVMSRGAEAAQLTSVVAQPEIAASEPVLPMDETAAQVQESDLSRADRRIIQLSLLHLGYYQGEIDGVFGPQTRAAIGRFQAESGERNTGSLSVDGIRRLLPITEGR